MKEHIKLIIKLFSFWMILFFIQRTLFILWNSDKWMNAGIATWFNANYHAFAMDLSTFCYFFLIIWLIIIANLFVSGKITSRALHSWMILFVVVSGFVHIADLGLYNEWGTKINRKAFSYLAYPKEAFASSKSSPMGWLILIWIVETSVFLWAYFKWIAPKTFPQIKKTWIKITFPIILLPFIYLGLRGGTQVFPIDRSWSYFNTIPVFNQAAVNSTWNALAVVFEPEEVTTNPYKYFTEKHAQQKVDSFFKTPKDTTISIFNIPKPNIVILMLESWSAEVVGILNKQIEAAPEFSALSKRSLLFSQFYATGFRTEQGLAAMVSGFPSQPTTTIIRKFGKFELLPALAQRLKQTGYSTSYYYGGDNRFANTQSYLQTMGFDNIYGDKDMQIRNRTFWGAYDEEYFDFLVKELGKNKAPFFSMGITSTSHEPFDAPVRKIFQGNEIAQLYKNTIHYTDSCLGDFFRKAEKQPWYKNTVFIVVSDHTHRYPYNRQAHEIERHWIPCLLTGGALRQEFAGKTISEPVCHTDLPATILSQLGLKHDEFIWSKNIFNPYASKFAYYTFDEGFGVITSKSALVYDHKLNKIIDKRSNENQQSIDSLTQTGKAILQQLMEAYVRLSN